MTRINPELFPEDAIVDDNSTTHTRKSWSTVKLDALFGAFLREVTDDVADRSVPTLSNVTTISSVDPFLTIEVFPSDGVLGVLPYKLSLLDVLGNVVSLPSDPFIIEGADISPTEAGKMFLRIPLPDSIVPNSTYTLDLEEGCLVNGNKYSDAVSFLLTSSSVTFVKPTFGAPVSVPLDSNHNFLSQINIPVTSDHSGRTLYFDETRIGFLGGTISVTSVVWNQALMRVEVNIVPGSMAPNTLYTLNILDDLLIDDDISNIGSSPWGNTATTRSLSTPPEVKPLFSGGVQTDSLNTNPADITKLYFNLVDLDYLNLQRDGSKFITITVGGSSEDLDFIVNQSNERVEVDLSLAISNNPNLVPNFISAEGNLLDNTTYNFEIPSGSVTDGLEINDPASFSFITDDEADILLGNPQTDTNGRAYGMSYLFVNLLGGPTFNNPPFTDFSGITINNTTANIMGGTAGILYNAALQRIEIPLQNMSPNASYDLVVPADSIMDGTSGHTEFTYTLNTLPEVAPVILSSDVTGNSVNYKTVSQVVLSVDDTLSYSGGLLFDSSKLQIVENGSILTIGSDYTITYDDSQKKIFISGLSLKYSTSYNITCLLDCLKDGYTGNDSLFSFPFTTMSRFNYVPTFGSTIPANGSVDLDYEQLNSLGSTFAIEIDTASVHDIAYSINPITLADVLVIDNSKITVTGNSNSRTFTSSILGGYLVINLDSPYVEGEAIEVSLDAGALRDGANDSASSGPYNYSTVSSVRPSFASIINPSGSESPIPEFTGTNRITIGITPNTYDNLSLSGSFPHGIAVSGADLIGVVLNPVTLELDLEVDNVILGNLQVDLPAGVLTDGIYSNTDTPTFSFTAVSAVVPEFSATLSTDSGNSKSSEISKLYIDITSDPHNNLQLSGSPDIRIRRDIDGVNYFEGVLDPSAIVINMTVPRLEISFVNPSDFSSFTFGAYTDIVNTNFYNKLHEDQSYQVFIGSGSLEDTGYQNLEFVSDPFLTDNELNPVISQVVLTNSGDYVPSNITELVVMVTGGPYVNDLHFNVALATQVKILNITDGGVVTQGASIYSSDTPSYNIRIPVISYGSAGSLEDGKEYKVEFPEGFIYDGSQGSAYYLSDSIFMESEIQPTVGSVTPTGSSVDYHFAVTTEIVASVTPDSYTNLQGNANLVTLEKKPIAGSVYSEVTSGITKEYNSGTIRVILTEGILEYDHDYRVTFPAGSFYDGGTLSAPYVHNFTTMNRSLFKPVLGFDMTAFTDPDNGATDVEPLSTTLIDIPFSSLHEAMLIINDSGPYPKFHLNDGTSDVSIASIQLPLVGIYYRLRITLTSPLDYSKTYTLGVDADAILDGTIGNDEVTLASSSYQFTTIGDTMDRRTIVLLNTLSNIDPSFYGNSNGPDAYVYTSGTRVAESIDMTIPEYDSAGSFYYDSDFNATPRLMHLIKIKAEGNTDPGQTLDVEVLESFYTAGSISNTFGGTLKDVSTGASSMNKISLESSPSTGYMYELVIFEDPKTVSEAQAWADVQDWEAYKSL